MCHLYHEGGAGIMVTYGHTLTYSSHLLNLATFYYKKNMSLCCILRCTFLWKIANIWYWVVLNHIWPIQKVLQFQPFFFDILSFHTRVHTAAFHTGVRGSVPGLGGLKEIKNVSSSSTCESQNRGEPPWPSGSVLGLRPPGLEFRILCLEDSVISIISPSSGGSPGPV